MDCPHQVEHVVGLSCGVRCLRLSARARNPLLHARTEVGTRLTVGDVLELARSNELIYIRNLGPLLVSEIELALIYAGFVVRGCGEVGNASD